MLLAVAAVTNRPPAVVSASGPVLQPGMCHMWPVQISWQPAYTLAPLFDCVLPHVASADSDWISLQPISFIGDQFGSLHWPWCCSIMVQHTTPGDVVGAQVLLK